MGEPNAALGVYMNNPDRIRSVLEYYMGEKLPEDRKYEELKGMYPIRNSKGRLTYRQRDLIGKVRVWGTHFLLGLENQERINLIFPWRLMEMDCLAYKQGIDAVCEENRMTGQRYEKEDDFLCCHRKEKREYFSRIPKSTVDVIDVCTNIKDIRKYLEFLINEENSEEEADMCYALEQIQRNVENRGKRQGVQQGIQQGIQQTNELVQRLLVDGRQEDLLRATADDRLRQRLLA